MVCWPSRHNNYTCSCYDSNTNRSEDPPLSVTMPTSPDLPPINGERRILHLEGKRNGSRPWEANHVMQQQQQISYPNLSSTSEGDLMIDLSYNSDNSEEVTIKHEEIEDVPNPDMPSGSQASQQQQGHRYEEKQHHLHHQLHQQQQQQQQPQSLPSLNVPGTSSGPDAATLPKTENNSQQRANGLHSDEYYFHELSYFVGHDVNTSPHTASFEGFGSDNDQFTHRNNKVSIYGNVGSSIHTRSDEDQLHCHRITSPDSTFQDIQEHHAYEAQESRHIIQTRHMSPDDQHSSRNQIQNLKQISRGKQPQCSPSGSLMPSDYRLQSPDTLMPSTSRFQVEHSQNQNEILSFAENRLRYRNPLPSFTRGRVTEITSLAGPSSRTQALSVSPDYCQTSTVSYAYPLTMTGPYGNDPIGSLAELSCVSDQSNLSLPLHQSQVPRTSSAGSPNRYGSYEYNTSLPGPSGYQLSTGLSGRSGISKTHISLPGPSGYQPPSQRQIRHPMTQSQTTRDQTSTESFRSLLISPNVREHQPLTSSCSPVSTGHHPSLLLSSDRLYSPQYSAPQHLHEGVRHQGPPSTANLHLPPFPGHASGHPQNQNRGSLYEGRSLPLNIKNNGIHPQSFDCSATTAATAAAAAAAAASIGSLRNGHMIPDRQATCPECHATFTSSGHLKRHLEAHGSGRRYKCHFCTCAYSRQDHLTKHLEKAHDVKKSGSSPSGNPRNPLPLANNPLLRGSNIPPYRYNSSQVQNTPPHSRTPPVYDDTLSLNSGHNPLPSSVSYSGRSSTANYKHSSPTLGTNPSPDCSNISPDAKQ